MNGLVKAEIFPNYFPSSQPENSLYKTVPEKKLTTKKAPFFFRNMGSSVSNQREMLH